MRPPQTPRLRSAEMRKRESEALRTCPWRQKILCPGNLHIECAEACLTCLRVEKYRPNSLDDVEGHKDIIATINKFVDSNVWLILS